MDGKQVALGWIALTCAPSWVAAQQFRDGFESYDAGAALSESCPWELWQGGGGEAYVVAGPGAGYASDQYLELAPGSDLVRRLAIESGRWTLTARTRVPSGAGGDGYLIALSEYGAPPNWSLQVRFSGDTGLVVNDFAGGQLPLIRDAWVEVRAEIDLEADRLDVYYADLPLATGLVWSQNVTVGGSTSIAALDLYSASMAGFGVDEVLLRPTYSPDYWTYEEAASFLVAAVPPPNDGWVWSPYALGWLPAGTRVQDPVGEMAPIELGVPSYLYWIDPEPESGFVHDTQIAVLDARRLGATPILGDGIELFPSQWWPVVVHPGGCEQELFHLMRDRCSDETGSATNRDGLVAGAGNDRNAISKDPIPPPGAQIGEGWGIVCAGDEDEALREEAKRAKGLLSGPYKLKENRIRLVNDGKACKKADFVKAIDDTVKDVKAADVRNPRVYIRLLGHGRDEQGETNGYFYFGEERIDDAELRDQLKKLTKLKNDPPLRVHLIVDCCRSGSLADTVGWDLTKGSTVISASDWMKPTFFGSFKDGNTKVTGTTFHYTIQKYVAAGVGDTDTSGIVEEWEAFDRILIQNPGYDANRDGAAVVVRPKEQNPRKRVIGAGPLEGTGRITNNTGDPVQGLSVTLMNAKLYINEDRAKVYKVNADGTKGPRWGTDNDLQITRIGDRDQVDLFWNVPGDPLANGASLLWEFRTNTETGLVLVRQELSHPVKKKVPGGNGRGISHFAPDGGRRFELSTGNRPESADGWGGNAFVRLSYKLADGDIPVEHLNLLDPLVASLPSHDLGLHELVEGELFDLALAVPTDVSATQRVLLVAEWSWTENANASTTLSLFGRAGGDPPSPQSQLRSH